MLPALPLRSVRTCFTIWLFFPFASAQIYGCDDNNVDCAPPGQSVFPVVCRHAADGIGVTSFDSALASKPLAWTIRGQGAQPATNNSQWTIYTKTFHLRTPPDVALNSPAFRGCAFLFGNISHTLQVEDGFDDWSRFSCDTMWGRKCSEDILVQGREYLDNAIGKSTGSRLAACAEIRDALQGDVTESCGLPDERGSWGLVVEKVIAGSQGAIPAVDKQEHCKITSGGSSYGMSFEFWDTLEVMLPDEDGRAGRWRLGSTPLMTMFFSDGADTARMEMEVHLTCLRTIPCKNGGISVGSGFGGKTLIMVMWGVASIGWFSV